MGKILIRPQDALRIPTSTFHPRHCFADSSHKGNWRGFPLISALTAVNPSTIPFEEGLLFRAMRSVLVEKGEWRHTQFFQSVAAYIGPHNPQWGCQSAEQFLARLEGDVPAIVESIRKYGFLSQAALIEITEGEDAPADLQRFNRSIYYDRTDAGNEIKVGIGSAGEIILLEGQHRAAAGRLLKIPIPAVVAFRHEEWQRMKDTAQLRNIDHPDINKETQLTTAFLRRADYLALTKKIGTGHWANAERRWVYHAAAVGFAQIASPSSPDKVLEMGTMGVNIVPGSHTIDYSAAWQFEGKAPTYVHDGRESPWPIASDTYELMIALRVFHHLSPNQAAAFKEARRIARNLIIVTPEAYDKVPGSQGIPLASWVSWNDGVLPTAVVELGEEFGSLYFWNSAALGR